MKKAPQILLISFFVIYGLLMFYLLFWQRIRYVVNLPYAEQLEANLNLVPFRSIRLFLRLLTPQYTESYRYIAIVNLLGNVFLFMPLGLFLPCLWQKFRIFWKFALCVTVIIIAVELIQLFLLLGSCDIDDLILNILGASLGFGIWKIGFINRALYNLGCIR